MPSPSTEPRSSAVELSAEEADLLLDIADAAIRAVLVGRAPDPPALDTLPATLHRPSGAFVTLTVRGDLNGCIGTVGGDEPLGAAVARLAVAAAVDDPRLPPLSPSDLSGLTIGLSLLSPLRPIDADSWNELRDAIRPARDGVVIEAGSRRGLFLPSVWDQLPDPESFLDHLYRKAGLRPRTWPRGAAAHRFTTRGHSRSAPSEGSAAEDDSGEAPSETSTRRVAK